MNQRVKKAKQHNGIRIPLDIVPEILLRLPAISVVRFRCACMLWNSITLDPKFIDTHLERAQKSRHPRYIIVATCDESRYKIFDYGSWTPNQLFPSIGELTWLQSSCNGLLFFYDNFANIQLLNPATGESFTPPTPITRPDEDFFRASLGFHPLTKEYKIISIHYDLNGSAVTFGIYTIGVDSTWRQINSGTDINYIGSSTVSKGTMYFYVSDRITSNGFVLVLDLKDESFTNISIPNHEAVQMGFTKHLRVENDSLHMIIDVDIYTMHIWMLNDNNHGWTLKYNLNLERHCIMDPLFIHNEKLFIFYGDECSDQRKDGIYYYDLKGGNDIKAKVVYHLPHMPWPYVACTHMESLVALPK